MELLGIIKPKQETNYEQAHKNMLQQVSTARPSLSLLCYWIFTVSETLQNPQTTAYSQSTWDIAAFCPFSELT